MKKDRLFLYEKDCLSECKKNAVEIISLLSSNHYFGFFETVLCLNSRPVLLAEHLERLVRSCKEFSVSVPGAEKLKREIDGFCSEFSSDSISVLKVTVLKVGKNSSLIHLAQGSYRYKLEELKKGFNLAIAKLQGSRETLLAKHKTTHRFELELIRQNATIKSFDDALLVDGSGLVLETTRANVFIYKNGKWMTPCSKLNFLAGIIRNFLLRDGLEGFRFFESEITLEDVLNAEEMVLTNSLIGAAPVGVLENGKRFRIEKALELNESLWKVFQKLSN